MANWRFILATRWHQNIGEILNASDRQVMLPLSGIKTLGFKVRLDNPLSDYMMLNEANYIKAYRGSTLMFHGPILTVEENGDAVGATLAVNAVGPEWFLWKISASVVAPSAPPQLVSGDRGILTSRGNLMGAGAAIDYGTDGERTVGDVVTNYKIPQFGTKGQMLNELSEAGFGFDWLVDPLDPSSVSTGSNPSFTGKLKLYGSLGSSKTNAVFEWGTGTRANIASYKKIVTRENQISGIYAVGGEDYESGGDITIANTPDSDHLRVWGQQDDFVTDIEDLPPLPATDRGDLLATHYTARKRPRQTIEIVPHIDPAGVGRLPNYGTDYSLGDTVRVRAVYGKSVRFDVMLRVWGVTFDIDNNGVERTSLTVSASL